MASAFTVVALPVFLRAGPLRDDFDLCTSPRWNSGLARTIVEILPETGAVRLPGRIVQTIVVSTLCHIAPFWVLILVPFLLTLLTAVLLICLLRDLGLSSPWPHIAASLFLLQPLGTESALWATQFNIPLGLALALLALLAFIRGRPIAGAISALVAYGFVEQVIFGLPLAVWLLAPVHKRGRALAWVGGIALITLAVYSTWPGHSERTAVAMVDRLLAPVRNVGWYVKYPAVSFGLHSIPLAFWWALPASAFVVAVASAAGAWLGPRLFAHQVRGAAAASLTLRHLGALLALILLINVPLLTTLPHPSSPRTFTPTWVALCTAAAMAGSRLSWRRPRLVGGLACALSAGALLSMALSVWVRVQTANFTEASSRWLAERVPNGGVVLICDVPRTVVTPAPAGDFAVHELIHPSAAEAAVRYYTEREISVRRVGALWPGPCEAEPGVDLIARFGELPRSARPR